MIKFLKKLFCKNPKVIMDMNLIPLEYKDLEVEQVKNVYAKVYGVDIVPVDMSRQNTDGRPGKDKIVKI